MGVHIMGVHIMGVHLMGVHITDVHLMGVHLMGVHITSVHLMTQCALLQIAMCCPVDDSTSGYRANSPKSIPQNMLMQTHEFVTLSLASGRQGSSSFTHGTSSVRK